MIATLSRIGPVVGAWDQLLSAVINQFTEYVAVPGPMMLVYIHSAIVLTTLLGLAMINVLLFINAIHFCAPFLVIRETKQYSLEEISSIFRLSTCLVSVIQRAPCKGT
ncbi:hypothetical protein BDV33DRAFT_174513 [Aspergillus novoparasiticus]|uniref:Uncharacterized protein n=1 Tax=Aspergillus novoparasiticus TaxID=986946 RepID=A0A5N6ENR8_9EURO|nr:hypothetical protein BDV33DRAFT_174513 [Aspergillus novoparasiticus]